MSSTRKAEDKPFAELLQQYSFGEGFVAGLEIHKIKGVLVIELEAVPYKKSHPKYSAVRLAKNSVKGMLYSSDDLCNGRVTLIECDFEILDFEAVEPTPKDKVLFETSRAIEFFDLQRISKNKNRMELVAEDIRVTCLFTDMTFSEGAGN